MKTIKAMIAGVSLTLAVSAVPAHAALIEQDLNVAGDKLVTLDDATGLQWLDVNLTVGQSFNTALSSVYVVSQGFRHATTAEVATLYTGNGAINLTQMGLASQLAVATEFLEKLSCTFQCADPTFRLQQGFTDEGSTPGAPFILVFPTLGLGAFRTVVSVSSKDSTQTPIGNYLVRVAPSSTPMPEPGTLGLMGLGLAGLGLARRKRRV